MSKQKFKTKLKKVGSWTIAPAPFDTFKVFGTKSHVRVKGTINGYEFGGVSLMPMGDGTHFLAIKSEIRKAIGKEAGDTVEIVVENDNSELKVPAELKEAFKASPEAKKMFEAYSYSHKKLYVSHIAEAKAKETKVRRAVESVLALEKAYFDKQAKSAAVKQNGKKSRA